MLSAHSQDQTMALDILHRVAKANGLKVATAESLTAGLISATIAEKSGCSAYHQGGIVAYNIDAKVNLLGVDRELAQACNCVSAAVATQMALGARQAFGANLVIAVTGYAEPWPDGGVEEPYAHYAILCGSAGSTGVIQLADMGRQEAREEVTTRTLCELAAMAESCYAG